VILRVRWTNNSGTRVYSWLGYPFGRQYDITGAGCNNYRFTGKEYDSEMRLNYFCQRYYDPEIGRFMTLDPFHGYIALPQTQNRYIYCINNPLKYIDPLGLDMQPNVPDPDDCEEYYYEWWWPIGTIIPMGGITV
jgi:RHS repeat-associated protein